MYSIKEKIKHHNDLKAEQHLPADIELLKQHAPAHDHIRRYNAGSRITDDEVLYELLNHATAEGIRAHRRQFTGEKKEDTPKKPKAPKKPAPKKEKAAKTPAPKKEKAPKKAAAPKVVKPKTPKAKAADVAAEAKKAAEEANENAAEAVDTANEALDTAKEALDVKKN